MSSGPRNEEDPPAGQSHAASSAEGPGGGEDPPYEDISRDHRAGGEAQNKTREVSQSPPKSPPRYHFVANKTKKDAGISQSDGTFGLQGLRPWRWGL